MRRLIWILFLGIVTFIATAQTANIKPESLLDISKRNQPAGGVYTGVPFVKIEPTVGAQPAEAKSGWMDEEKKRLFGTTQITQDKFFQPNVVAAPAIQPSSDDTLPEISYKTPFGNETSAIYTTHTTDFISMIQILDNQSIAVEEIIQFIQTEEKPFSRVLPANKGNKFNPDSFQLLHVEKNGQPFDLNVQINADEILLSHEMPLPAGIHQFRIKYIIRSGIGIQDGNGILDYNITGYKWPMPVNRFWIYVSFPSKTTVFEKDIAFGANDIVILNSYTHKEDSNGNSLFVLKNPLPAFAGVKVYEKFKSTIFTDSALDRFINKYINIMIVLLIIGTVFVYLGVSALYLRFKKPETDTFKFIQSFSPETLAYAKNGTLHTSFLKELNAYQEWCSQNKKKQKKKSVQKIILYRLALSRWWHWGARQIIELAFYTRISGKYWLTTLCMIVGIAYLSTRQNIHLTFIQYFVTLIISGIMIIIFFRKWGKQELLKEIGLFRSKLTQARDFYGLNEQGVINLFTRHYPRMLAIGAAGQWVDLTATHAPAIKNLPFIPQQIKGEKDEKTN